MTLLIAITGGSGSGKTTLAEALVAAMRPGAAALLSEDDWYVDAAALPDFDPAVFDFDDVAARDHTLMTAQLAELKAGRAVDAPVYSMETHGREAFTRRIEPAEAIVVEGVHALSTPALAALYDIKVFVDTPADIRFIRRLLRDQVERGRTPDSVVDQYLKTVRPGHERFTEPTRAVADFVVADATAAVRLADPQDVLRLAAPLLVHPLIRPLLAGAAAP
ncbi:MAG: uridine kinase [Alphaproteobacteria bacterium]|nr:uridine kinase [Alphaproteobacteria bacterium]MBU1525541.1 uridine kinase [Alphaproteobacteria bacterium]MBU2117816.1 uridine kinase [Alphaproteobacteria bacterium]MBU2350476.1 uridine kinase [Alphaproteobacteria bacterium]MBU2381531.1 uridine kinase [Alphaproteobacteria bacterium]